LKSRYRAIIAYDGTGYHGFQRQAAEHEPTIQGEIERALAKVNQPGITVLVVGAPMRAFTLPAGDRLDAEWRHSLEDLQRALNATLPADIAVLDIAEAAQDFHPRYDATSREYVYTIYNAPVRRPLYRHYALHVAEPLDMARMNAAAAALVGEHDFAAFGLPTVGQVTVRRMLKAECFAQLRSLTGTCGSCRWSWKPVASCIGWCAASWGRFWRWGGAR